MPELILLLQNQLVKEERRIKLNEEVAREWPYNQE